MVLQIELHQLPDTLGTFIRTKQESAGKGDIIVHYALVH